MSLRHLLLALFAFCCLGGIHAIKLTREENSALLQAALVRIRQGGAKEGFLMGGVFLGSRDPRIASTPGSHIDQAPGQAQ